MTDREAIKMALEALSWIANVNAMDYEYQRKAREPIESLRQALAQPEPPFQLTDAGVDTNIPLWGLEPKGSGMVALHQREWVGLTDDEVFEFLSDGVDGREDINNIEELLRSKNT